MILGKKGYFLLSQKLLFKIGHKKRWRYISAISYSQKVGKYEWVTIRTSHPGFPIVVQSGNPRQ